MRVKEGCLLNNLDHSGSGELTRILDFITRQKIKTNGPLMAPPALTAASLLRDLRSAWLSLKWTGSFIVLGWQGVEEQIDKDAWVSGKLGGS